MKLILAILFAFLALSMGFRSRLNNNNMFMNTMQTGSTCEEQCGLTWACSDISVNGYCCGCKSESLKGNACYDEHQC
jgi:hypothetical protein